MKFPDPTPIHLVPVPGTPFVYLEHDQNFRRAVAELGTIVIETAIAELPEVKALTSRDVVLDVGAFIGDTAIIFAKTGAQVIAFEPQIDAFAAALINLRDFPRARVLNCAIGDGRKVKRNADELAGNLGTRTVQNNEAGDMVAEKLDQVIKWKTFDRVTFIKIDVEGFEPLVIQGALELLKRDRPKLLIELYPEMLARHGFTIDHVLFPLKVIGYSRIREVIGNSTEPRWDILCEP